jgi:hypothetical protein
MYSQINSNVLYQDTSSDVTEYDIDVVSDLWSMDGRDVYRGARDPRYTHANVYWLYNQDLERVGCCEHDREDHGRFHLLWFHESPFATLLQEDGWTTGDDLWSVLPNHVCERFFNEGWTTPVSFLEHCLDGPLRILTPDMVVNLPNVYTCSKCERRSLVSSRCMTEASVLDLPDKAKIYFVDDDLVLHRPPPDSVVWSRLSLQRDDDSSKPTVQEQAVQSESRQEPPLDVAPRPPSPTQSSSQIPL